MKKVLLSVLVALPMAVGAAETYKIFSTNQSTNFFEGSSGGDESGGSLGETGPGPTSLDGNGDEQAGFYGEVPTSEMFTGTELATEIGLTAGVAQHDSAPWLKFAYKGKVLYVAKKPYRNDVTWSNIEASDAVYGGENGTIVSKSGYDFKVRLLKCASNDPTNWDGDNSTEGVSDSYHDPTESIGSEWNNLMYRIHQYAPETQEGDNWANYTNSDVIVSNGNGRITWCQEKANADSFKRVRRGYTSLSYFGIFSKSLSGPAFGWRPVLELQ